MIADPLAGLARPFVIVEDRLAPGRPARLFADPVEIVACDDPAAFPAALAALEAGLARGLHAAGFLSYEAGYLFEPDLAPLMPERRRLPLLWFGLFAAPREVPGADLDRALAARPAAPPITDLVPGHDLDAHVARVRTVLDHLDAGDAYQINLTFPLAFRWSGDPLALWASLRAAQPAAHGALVALPEATIASVSPELFLRVEGDRLTTRPMKGTSPRGADPAEDAALAAALAADDKQRAENLMIVDLMRNDLSRVAVQGSVKVPDLFRVETYPTLHTMTSTVTARLAPGVRPAEVLAAAFPCGSITGAPKHMAMKIIRRLEIAPRDVYTGAVGTLAPNGDIDLSVAIRTAALHADGSGTYGVGGGIVADSKPTNEYEEAFLKGRVLTDMSSDFGLIETLRWSRSEGFVRRDSHLARLARSAAELGFPLNMSRLEMDLAALVAALVDDAPRRVRIELARDGTTSLAAPLLGPEPDRPLRVGLARDPVDAGDPFLRHKTTRRARWDAASAEATRLGLDDMVFVNRDGFLTESTRADLFVERDGRLLTPALHHGLLPGVLRQELIETGRAIEADLTPEDLVGASWFLGNSLRGPKPARLER